MYLCLHQGTGPIASFIKWQTRGKYSHASVLLRDGSVIEAREFCGVRHLPALQPRPGEIIDRYWIPTTDAQALDIEIFLLAQIGKGYDYLSVFRFIPRTPVEHWNKTKWFCSDLAFACFQAGGIQLLNNIAAWAVSPELLSLSPIPVPQFYALQNYVAVA